MQARGIWDFSSLIRVKSMVPAVEAGSLNPWTVEEAPIPCICNLKVMLDLFFVIFLQL